MDNDRLPIRILYKGASTVMWQSTPDRRPPGLLPYPRVVEQRLRAHGHDTVLAVSALSAVRATSILRDWEEEATSTSPDVIVLHFGHMEAIHALIPRWVERHARSGRERPGRLRDRYRSLVVRPVYKFLALAQQRYDRALPAPLARRLARHRAQTVVAMIERYVAKVDRYSSPLYVVMGLAEPGPLYRSWFPGVADRMTVIDAALRDLVRRRSSPRMVYLEVWDEVAAWDERGVDPRPDGAHYTPEFHEVVGDRLAEVIRTWASTQPHLR